MVFPVCIAVLDLVRIVDERRQGPHEVGASFQVTDERLRKVIRALDKGGEETT